VQLFVAVEHVRQVEHLELAHAERAEFRERGRQHLHRPQLQRLHLLAVLEERAVRVDLDFHAALRALLGELLELLGALALRRVDRDDVTELDDDRPLRRSDADDRHHRRGSRGEHESDLHETSSTIDAIGHGAGTARSRRT
jgi:hypothetical protein